MKELSLEAKQIRKQGWKQGSLLKIAKLIKANRQQSRIVPGLYILISQDCDIQTPPISIEPYVEIILCKPIEKIEGGFARGKNPRRIHISLRNEQDKVSFECEAKNRFFLDRNKLIELKPYEEFSVTQEVVDNLIEWLVKRYQRDAFPDSFNYRRDVNKLRKIIKASHESIRYVIIRLHTEEELPANESYKILLHILIDEDTSYAEREKIRSVLNELVKELERKGEIQVIDSDVLSLDQISLGEFLNFRQLDFDDLSFPEN